jgi:hypothetical protein
LQRHCEAPLKVSARYDKQHKYDAIDDDSRDERGQRLIAGLGDLARLPHEINNAHDRNRRARFDENRHLVDDRRYAPPQDLGKMIRQNAFLRVMPKDRAASSWPLEKSAMLARQISLLKAAVVSVSEITAAGRGSNSAPRV